MILGIDHVGIAIKNLDDTLKLYRDALGLKVDSIMDIEAEKIKDAFVRVGNASLEVMEPTDPSSAVGKFIGAKGPGLQHISFRVSNIEEAIAEFKGKGLAFISEKRVCRFNPREPFVYRACSRFASKEVLRGVRCRSRRVFTRAALRSHRVEKFFYLGY